MPIKQKILFIANGIVGKKPGISGGDLRFIEIAKWWQSQKHQVHILSTDSGCHLCQQLGLKAKYFESIKSPTASRFVFILYTLISPLLVIPALSFKQGIVYSCNDMFLDVLPGFILKMIYGKNITWITIVHWLPPFPPWVRKESTVFNSIFFYINQRVSLFLANNFADFLFPVSDSTHAQLVQAKINHQKIFIVQCGVNYRQIQSYQPSKVTKHYDAVFMKRLQTVKGAIDIITIWEKVVKVKPKAKLLIIGDGPEQDNIKQMILAKHLQNNITLTGVIYDFDKKYRYLFQSKMFVLPSYEENWAIVIGEAMACGLPVIAYQLPELDSAWQNNYLASPLGNTQKFAHNILSLLDDPKKRRRMSLQSRQYVQQFDWSNIALQEFNILTQ